MLFLSFKQFSKLGRVLRTTLPYWYRKSGSSVCCLWLSGGGRRCWISIQLTDKLLQAVLVETKVVWIGQPMLITGVLNADLVVIPCLAKGISAGRYVDLALAYSLGLVLLLLLLVILVGRMALVLIGIFLLVALMRWLLLLPCFVTGRWFTPHFSAVARFPIDAWLLMFLPVYVTLCGLPVGQILLKGLPRRLLVLFRISGDVYREKLESGSWGCCAGSSGCYLSPQLLMSFWTIWCRSAEEGLFRAYSRAGGPTEAGIVLNFLAEVFCEFVAGVWEVELLVGRGSGRLYRAKSG